MTQTTLASSARTSQPAISHMESGARVPNLRVLLRVVEAAGFGVVIGLWDPRQQAIAALGIVETSQDDGLADFIPMATPSVFAG